MKKRLFILLAVAAPALGCSQKLTGVQPPSLVQNSLQVKYPAAKMVEWEKEGALYEAEFAINQIEHTVLLDATGRVVMHKQEITSSELPQEVTLGLQRDFPSHLLDDLEKVEKDGRVYFQVELENNNQDLKKVYASDGSVANLPFWD
ncbi:hypothetical protein [Sabulibacter ruber]|uniref:hypothetical protein n=1 Tax=Sabulibacter ruber TaxID=2811901 RepID=UPI001A956F1A|nr:hypothetical protein [Sabulibacter ruber]